jgi:NADPH:quinone reductase
VPSPCSNLAIDSKLRGCDVVALKVEAIAPNGYATDRATVRQRKTGRPVKFELTDQTRQAVDAYLRAGSKKPGEFLFTTRRGTGRCMTTRQYARLVSGWIASISMGGSAMKLIQFRTPGPVSVLECLDVPIPEPRSDEVLIRAHAIGVGMPDVLIRAGTYNFMPPLPAVPGQELSGTIERVGAGVTTRRPGQRVYTSARERPHRGGHYAEFVATPADATFLLPDTVTFDAAATLANYQVAYHIFNDAVRLRKGQSVLIYAAAGGMGNALIDLAKAADLVVIGVVSGEEKSKFARNLGADHVIDRKAEKVGERIKQITRDRGVDIIIDPVAGPTIPDNIRLLAPCGVLVLYGALGGKAQHDLQPTLRLTKNSPAVRQFTIHTWDDLVEERRAGMRALIEMLAAGKLHPRIHGHLPLAEAKRAHEMLESGAVLGKLLLRP